MAGAGSSLRDGNWRDRAESRHRQARFRRLALGATALAVLGGGAAVFLATRPDPRAELTESAKAFAADWPTMPVDQLCSTWFVADLTPAERSRLDRIFTRRGWMERRPRITYLLDEMRHDERKGRSEYAIEGFPPDRPLKVFWDRVDGSWRVTAPSIPVLEDE